MTMILRSPCIQFARTAQQTDAQITRFTLVAFVFFTIIAGARLKTFFGLTKLKEYNVLPPPQRRQRDKSLPVPKNTKTRIIPTDSWR